MKRCDYFVLCTNPAVGTVANPIIGPVPACERCAARVDLPLTRYEDMRK